MERKPMEAEIILKSEEKELLLQIAPENSPARSVLIKARSDESQPELVVINCDEQTAPALLEVAAPHCGCAWRVMNYQMSRLGLLHPEAHLT
jgi:hypothetical protein